MYNHPLSSKLLNNFNHLLVFVRIYANIATIFKKNHFFIRFIYVWIDWYKKLQYLFGYGDNRGGPNVHRLVYTKNEGKQSQASLVTGPCVTYNQICLHFQCSLAVIDIFWINIGVHFVEIKNAIIKTSIYAPISGSFHEAEGT